MSMTIRVNVLRLLVALLAGGGAIGCAVLAYLVYPGEPGASRSVKFEGFIVLPRRGALNVQDYLTLSGHTLFATAESSGSVFKILLDPGDRAQAVAVEELPGKPSAHGVALLPSRNRAFVSRSEANTVDLFDPETMRDLGSVPVADDADAILYVPGVNLIYLAHGDAHLATLIDPERGVAVGTIPLNGKPEFAVYDARDDLVYQNLQDLNSIAAIDLRTRSVIGLWPLQSCAAPTGLALDLLRRRLFAVCNGNAKLVVFDMVNHRMVASLEIGGGPDSVAYDPSLQRIYSAGRAGKLTIVQQDGADSYRVLEQVSTHYGAHTLAVDPVSHKVYVAYASLFVAPRIAVFSARR
jgi:DNA-binding beta-propeller fold protein YncE